MLQLLLPFVALFSGSIAAADVWIERNDCDLIVAFPEQPRVSQVFSLGAEGVRYEHSHSEVLRAEFLTVSSSDHQENPRAYQEILSNYAVSNGLQNWTVILKLSQPLPHAYVRGYKLIDGRQVVYKSTLYLRDDCALALMVATLASMYPTNWISAFEYSVRLK